MKILYVIPGMGGGGGAERSLATMVPYWSDHIDLQIVTFSARDTLTEELRAAGVTLKNFGPVGRTSLTRALTQVARAEMPDLVHTTLFDADVPGRVAASLARIPVSSSLVNVNYGAAQRRAPGRSSEKLLAAQLLDATTAQRVSRFHALTNEVATVMSRRLLIRPSKVEVIPRGRDGLSLGHPTMARRIKARTTLGVGENPLIVAAARHEWQKGLDVLVRSMPTVLESVPNAKLKIGGPAGQETAALEDLLTDLDMHRHVEFIGPRDDVPELMCAADVFCVPSRWEGFGSILLEAMALGVPTVASDIKPIREVNGDARWLTLVCPDDPTSLAGGIVSNLTNLPAASKRVARGLNHFDSRFRADIVASQMLDFFDRAASSRTSR